MMHHQILIGTIEEEKKEKATGLENHALVKGYMVLIRSKNHCAEVINKQHRRKGGCRQRVGCLN